MLKTFLTPNKKILFFFCAIKKKEKKCIKTLLLFFLQFDFKSWAQTPCISLFIWEQFFFIQAVCYFFPPKVLCIALQNVFFEGLGQKIFKKINGHHSTDPWPTESYIMCIVDTNCCKVLQRFFFFLSTITTGQKNNPCYPFPILVVKNHQKSMYKFNLESVFFHTFHWADFPEATLKTCPSVNLITVVKSILIYYNNRPLQSCFFLSVQLDRVRAIPLEFGAMTMVWLTLGPW